MFHNQPLPSGIYTSVACTSLCLTVPRRNRTLYLFVRGAKLRLDLLRSRKNAFISVSIVTQRILPDGFSFSLLVYTASEWLADFAASFSAVCARSHRLAADFLYAVSLVFPAGVPGLAVRENVLCDCGLSPLFFAPLV